MSSKNYSYAERLDDARLLLEGISKHKEELAVVGVDDAYIQSLTQLKVDAEQIDADQERLKAELKTATDKKNKAMKKLMKAYSRTRTLVKMTFPYVAWLEFGISAKH
jgi:exopolysaccharide biosynthesis protein